jgi:hypothetical protein
MSSNKQQPGADDPSRSPVVQREDGLWAIGLADDAPGAFESRAFAEAVASQEATTRAA